MTQRPVSTPHTGSPERSRLALPRLPRWIKGIFLAGAIGGTALGVAAAAIFRLHRQRSSSMWPTVSVGEQVIARRATGSPERGSIVVFRSPEDPRQSLVKRVVGLPGDLVVVTNGELSINAWKVPRCLVGQTSYVEDAATGEGGMKHEGTLSLEYLGGATYLVFEEKAMVTQTDAQWTVASGDAFVLGDNRNLSHDSRTFRGTGGGVPFASIQGRVQSHDNPELPPPEEASLRGALAACLANRPAQTTPPPK